MSSQDRKIVEHEGVKYYKKEGQWYRLVPIEEDKVLATKKSKKGRWYYLVPIGEDPAKINLQPEILLDIFKFLNFVQLLAVQETSFYFKNFIDKYGKELARKKYDRLEFLATFQLHRDRKKYEDYNPYPKCYYLKLDENVSLRGLYGFCESDYEFIKLEPQLYDFKLSEQLEEKWKTGIENSIPMFLTTDEFWEDADDLEDDDFPPIDTIFCKLQDDYKGDKALYYLQLTKFPKNIVEMKIARYLLQLFFNCAFDYFLIDYIIINPQMIDLLFDEDKTIIKPLQIHSKMGEVFFQTHHVLNFAVNHLICNQFRVRVYDSTVEPFVKPDTITLDRIFEVKNCIDPLIEILKNEGNKFFAITYGTLDSRIYNSIIKYIETSQDLSKMAKYIEFDVMYGSLVSSKNAENIKTKLKEDIKTTKFLLSNDHNPKIKFYVCIEDKYKRIDVSMYEDNVKYMPGVRVVIKRIK